LDERENQLETAMDPARNSDQPVGLCRGSLKQRSVSCFQVPASLKESAMHSYRGVFDIRTRCAYSRSPLLNQDADERVSTLQVRGEGKKTDHTA
jgi:hypothetical protein